MKKYILIIIILPFISFSQNGIKVSGFIQNSKKEAISFSNVLLVSMNDSLVTKSTTANEYGYFYIDQLEKGMYLLKIGAFGYDEYQTKIVLEDDLDFSDLVLQEENTLLDHLVINYKRPIVKRKIDRLEFTIEGSILATDNAWEIVKKTPGVMVSAGESISVRGNNSILVTINDKKVYLSGEELKQLLENTSGEYIKSVEVITSPPAKYEAQGGAIININMRKNTIEGYKASIRSAYVQSMYAKGVISATQNYKTKKLSLSGGYSFGTGTYYREGKDVIHYIDEQKKTVSQWVSFLNRKNKASAQNSYNLSGEYAIDSLNVITFGTNGYLSTNSKGIYNVPTYIYDNNGKLDSLYTTRNERMYPRKTSTYAIGYEYKINEKEKMSFSSDYTKYYNKEFQDIYSVFSLADYIPYKEVRFVSDNLQKIQLFSAQGDYVKEVNEVTFEAGAKFGRVNANSRLDFKDEKDGQLIPNSERTSQFLYDENIYAGYLTYAKEFDKWSIKAGLRGEFTELKGNSVTTKEINTQEYFKIFPTLYSVYKPVDGQEIGLAYSKRISRPQYSWLNPFKSYYNSYSYFTGDPALKPAIIHNLSLLYTLATTYNFDFYYRNETNPSMEISYQDYDNNILVYKFTNIKKRIGYGLDFNTNLELFSWWQSGIETSINYGIDTFQGVDREFHKNKRVQFSTNTSNKFTLNQKKDFTAEVNWFYTSPSIQGTFTISSFSSLSVSLRKLFLEGKGEVSVIFSDVYRGEKQKITTNYANQFNYFYDYNDTQSFRLAFKYSIGNQKIKNLENKKETEEQKRL